ncbi:toxin glutamine deamidase domain-containing protein [Streptomyces sp. NBC_01450]|uniref:toxin glutamine deamidase domain-containing protein n=1 Tax=Streptomyces sp. NBC_01450 TaxID=2903871 RepID=UPI002E2FC9C8|nr:toxin glutamine deamidase domain-containing protein [Streptomyces sp. NBC_01450]
MTAVPVHTVIRTPGSSTPTSHHTPATPQPPGSPQTDPGTPTDQQHPQQDSLQDIRADLDHYPGGLTDPDPADQQALADAVPHNEDGTPERFPDPFGSWSQLQNDGGNTVPGRSNNCADCSRSFLETWYGNPQVSAPRTPDTDEHGNPDPFAPENNANENQIRWTGAAHAYAGPGNDPETANNIASVLQQSGPGSAAIVQVDWPGGGGHAFNVVNHDGNIVWIDTQSGEVSNQPLHIDNSAHVWHIPLDADRNPIDTTPPEAENSENQNDDGSQPENSENNGQPENSQNPQNDASGDTPKQTDDTDTGTNSPKPAGPATPDSSNNADPSQPSTADPNTTPDPTNGEPANGNGRPPSQSNTPSEPNSTPDGRKPSQDTPESRQPSPDDSNADPQQQPQQSPETPSEQNRLSPAETPSTPDQQSRPNEATHPDEQGRTPDKESEQPTATTESPARPDSPSEHGQPPTDTTPDNVDIGTPDKATTPTRTATSTPNDPTTNRDTPQQTTTPSDLRTSIRHQQITDRRTTNSRTADRTSPNPLHSGSNGVLASPLDANRQPVTSTPDRGSQDSQASRQPDATSASADRRAPTAPAGTDSGGGHDTTERPQGSATYDTSQSRHDTHYGMLPEPSQAHLRETNDVTQTDLAPVYDRIGEWSNNGELSSLLGDRLADEQGGIRKSTLINALTGFADLTEGQQGAVVAALARMDLRFHATSAVGVALDPDADNPNSPANFTPHTTDPEKIERSNAARKVIGQLMDKAGIKSAGLHYHAGKAIPGRAALTEAIHQRISEGEGLTDSEMAEAVQNELQSLTNHKGDWSRKNFAVIEVRDPQNNNEIRYVVDSSLPMSSAWGAGVHSEPHAMEWIKSVNAQREAAGEAPFEPVSLYTEREPCGHASGNDCSGYISDEIEEPKDEDQLQEGEKKNALRIHYGVGFRRGQIDDNADLSKDDGTTATVEEAKEEARKKFTGDFNNYVNHLKGIWEGNAKAGSMSS